MGFLECFLGGEGMLSGLRLVLSGAACQPPEGGKGACLAGLACLRLLVCGVAGKWLATLSWFLFVLSTENFLAWLAARCD